MKRRERPPPLSPVTDKPRWRRRLDRGTLLASLILVLALSATLLGWYNAYHDAHAAHRDRFRDNINELLAIIRQTVVTREGILLGGAALFRASDRVTEHEWYDYVTSLALARNFPDVVAMGYAPRVARDEVRELERIAEQQAIDGFRIHPDGPRPFYVPVLYLEPKDPSHRALRGFDLQSEPLLHLALERARIEASPVVSSPVGLLSSGGDLTLFYPVFTGRLPEENARDHPLIGYVFSCIDLERLVERTFGNRLSEFAVQIYDGPGLSRPIYDSRDRTNAPSAEGQPTLSDRVSFVASGHEWTVRFSTLPRFDEQMQLHAAHIILAAGSAISLLLFLISLTLATTRRRAWQLAAEMNQAFIEERARLREITATLGEGLYVQDAAGTITFTNPAAEQILGYEPGELTGRATTELLHPSALSKGVGLNPHALKRREVSGFAPEETTFLRKNGTPLPVSVVSTPILRDGTAEGSVVAFQDISERRRAESALRAGRQFEALFRYSSDALFLVEMDGRIVDANQVAQESLGYSREELIGSTAEQHVRWSSVPPPGQSFSEFFHRLDAAHPVRGEAEHLRRDGTSFVVEVIFSLVTLAERKMVLASARDITARKEAERRIQRALDEVERSRREAGDANRRLAQSNEELKRVSRHDSLTGIANRRNFDEYLDLEWNRAARDHRPLSLLLIDVDHFKKFNDHYGHQAGDECLRRVAVCLNRQLSRSIDMVARYGGEEFAVVLPETPLLGAANIGERLRRTVEELHIAHDLSAPYVTISIGVAAIVPRFGTSRAQLIAAADEALYKAKRTGRNRVCTASRPGE